MEGAAYPPSTQPEHPHSTGIGYYPGPKQFITNNPPPPYLRQSVPTPTPPAHWQVGTNLAVVRSQPSVVATTFRPVGDHFLTLGIVLTIFCVLCGTWHALLCTIPAIIFSTMARDADARGDNEAARTNGRIALGLNIGGLVAWMFVIIGIIIAVIAVSTTSTDNICYRYNSYGTYKYTYSYYCYK